MADFAADTRLEGGGGRYRVALSPDWEVWGPLGGYVAAIALRAMGAECPGMRPASVSCQFLAAAAFTETDVEVVTLRAGKRSRALHVRMMQEGRAVHAATGWVVDAQMLGLEHDHAAMPDVPPASALRSYAELADDFADWFPVWHRAIDGRPVGWHDEPQPPVWRAWMRLLRPVPPADPFLDAARSLMWMDLMMWNAALQPHLPWPVAYVAPNLDVSAIFHAGAAEDEWLLCDSDAPVARGGIVGCSGRVWSPAGRLVASGSSCLFCRPNPRYEQDLERRRVWDAERRRRER
jgi:acyl-CoA thioesterase-2